MSFRNVQVTLAPSAKNDISDILLYTRSRWGTEQRKRYKSRIQSVLGVLSQNPEIGLKRPEISPGLRSFPVEEHLIFYRFEDSQITILRVVHQNRDLGRIFSDLDNKDPFSPENLG